MCPPLPVAVLVAEVTCTAAETQCNRCPAVGGHLRCFSLISGNKMPQNALTLEIPAPIPPATHLVQKGTWAENCGTHRGG